MIMETLFYLPNCFRQTLLVNSNNISFTQPSEALLDLMNIMFKVDSTKIIELYDLRLINIFSPYKTFFGSTMFYEGIGMGMRMTLYDTLEQKGPSTSSFVNGALSGMISQVLMQPLFLKNLKHQKKYEVSAPRLRIMDNLNLVCFRGAILGICHLTVFNTILRSLEQPSSLFAPKQTDIDERLQRFLNLH